MKKTLMALFLVFLLILFQTERVYADVTASAQLISYSTKFAPLLIPFGPEIALVACAIVAAGVVYQNREQIVATATNVYNHMINQGIPFVRDSVTGAIDMTIQARDFIVNDIASLYTQSYVTDGGGVVVPGQYIIKGTYQRASDGLIIPFMFNKVLATGWSTGMAQMYGQLMFIIYLDGVANAVDVLSGMKDYKVTSVTNVSTGEISNDGSICADLPSTMFPTGSINIPLATDNIPVGSISVPLNPPIGGTWGDVGSIPISGDTSWDTATGHIGAIPYSGDIPIDGGIDIPTTEVGFWGSILGWLAKILDAIKAIPGAIIDWLSKLLDAIKAIPAAILAFFAIDWASVTSAMDYTDVWKSHFSPFYAITDSITNISANPQNSGGKFYMVIPKAMGGDGSLQCVLDYTVAGVYITWPRIFLGWAIWLAFGWWILEQFKPKININ